VRLLPCESVIRNVVIDGVIDTSQKEVMFGGIMLGDVDASYGRNLPGSLRNITVSNVICNNTQKTIQIDGYLQDSTISNVIAANTRYPAVCVLREGGLKNVKISNVLCADGESEILQ
jgi:hypothetical protein